MPFIHKSFAFKVYYATKGQMFCIRHTLHKNIQLLHHKSSYWHIFIRQKMCVYGINGALSDLCIMFRPLSLYCTVPNHFKYLLWKEINVPTSSHFLSLHCTNVHRTEIMQRDKRLFALSLVYCIPVCAMAKHIMTVNSLRNFPRMEGAFVYEP
jgi:hypothetical protein